MWAATSRSPSTTGRERRRRRSSAPSAAPTRARPSSSSARTSPGGGPDQAGEGAGRGRQPAAWSRPDLSRYTRRPASRSSSRARRRPSGAPTVSPRPTVFRPPYGATNATVNAEAKALGLKTILWSIDSYDSRGYSTANIAHTVLKLVQPGAIVLMHDVIPATATRPTPAHPPHRQGAQVSHARDRERAAEARPALPGAVEAGIPGLLAALATQK